MHILHWRKSTHSGDSSNCVEIATAPSAVHIRDSKTTPAPHLTVTVTVTDGAWASFLAYARRPDTRAVIGGLVPRREPDNRSDLLK
ncbi:DUF397 domain-containing protein [Streptomyces sp. NPDC048254]|uniref:DUF397 domain-containing protein n=1 Tax=Streptomyces sp. NPDC048254 TaxID=3365525 RepID=UPI00371D4F8E